MTASPLPTRIAVLVTTRRGAPEVHSGFGVLSRLPSVLAGEDVVTVHTDDDMTLAKGAVVAFGGPDPDRFAALLGVAPGLRWYHTLSAGVERLLPIMAEHPALVVTNNSGAYDMPIAEHVIGSIFAIAKRQRVSFEAQQRREWHDDPSNQDISGASLVVLGMGSIGGEVARLAGGLRMKVTGVRRSAVDGALGPERLADAAADADYLAICAPLTDSTRGLVGREVIARMKHTAWIINISRGPIVDEAALLEACRDRRIGGAAIDAWWEEPLPNDSPWWGLDNVIVTPHTSYSSPSLADRTVAFALENLRRYQAGEELLNVVSLDRGY